jgi:hypothetical protein
MQTCFTPPEGPTGCPAPPGPTPAGFATERQPDAPRLLIVGGRGHLGQTTLMPALQQLDSIAADCLDLLGRPA